MLHRLEQIGISILFCLVFHTGLTQSSQQLFKIINWLPEDRLPVFTNHTMTKDSLGFLWFTSPDGLYRFDGSSFQGYHSTDRNKTIVGKETLGLIEDSLHNIWIGSDSGLNRYDIRADSFQNFYLSKKNISGNNYFVPFHATKNEVWYIDRNEGILAIDIYSGKKRILFNKVQPVLYYQKLTYTFYDPVSQSIWYPGQNAIVRFSLKDGKAYTSLPDEKENSLADLKRILVVVNDAKRHCVWFAQQGLNQLDMLGSAGKKIKYLETFSSILSSRISAMALDKENRLWIGTRTKGIFIYDPEKNSFQHLFREAGSPNTLQSNMVRNIYIDRDGIVWAGTGFGFDQMTNNTAIQHYTDFTENGNDLSSGNVRTLAEGKGGKIWIGSWDGIIDIFDPSNGTFETLSKKDVPNIPIDRIRVIRIDTISNIVWIAADFQVGELTLSTKKYKQIIFKNVQQEIVNPLSVLSQHWEALNDSVWVIGTWYGAYTYKRGSGVAYQLPFLIDSNIQYIGKGKNIVFFNSLDLFPEAYEYNNERWDSLGRLFGNIPVHCILWDTLSQNWWVCSKSGLYHLDKDFKTIRRYTIEDGLPDNTINSIIKDKKGLFWLGTFKGLCVFDPQKESFNYVGAAYGRRDVYYQRSFLLASNGDIYMGGGDGLDRIQPDRIIYHFPPAKIYFKSLRVDKKNLWNSVNVNQAEVLPLKYFQNNINIEIGVLDFYSQGSNQIRYKMSRLTNDWQYSKANQQIRYGSLAPGKYEFIMQAANANNEWNGEIKSIKFIIGPPFWGTWWFRMLCVLVIAAIVYTIYRYRINQLKKLFAIRSKISQDLHDEIGSSLTSINILSKVSQTNLEKDPVKSAQLLEKITEQSDTIQQSMSDIVWTIRPDNDKLQNMVIRMREYLGHTAEAKDFQVEFDVDEKISNENLGMQQRQHVFLIFKEAVNNAVKYSHGRKIIVRLKKENHQIKLSIEDNGIGFDVCGVTSSSGLKNMRERANKLKGVLNIVTSPGKGTKVVLSCPPT